MNIVRVEVWRREGEFWRRRPPHKLYYVFWAYGDVVSCWIFLRYLKKECKSVIGSGIDVE